MSSILLSNPFVTPAPQPSGPQETVPPLAVAPTQSASTGSGSGNATSFSGSGYGGGSDQHSAAALIRSRTKSTMAAPSNATGTSVINAQTQDGVDVMPFGANLPKVAMPDPLPTSPFLKAMSERA